MSIAPHPHLHLVSTLGSPREPPHVRSKTENVVRVFASQRKRVFLRLLVEEELSIEFMPRPRTRGECEGVSRPCPFVSCKFNLYLDVNAKTGAIKFNFPHLEPDEMKSSCALDVADEGGNTLLEIGEKLSLVRERVRQIEEKAKEKLGPHFSFVDKDGTPKFALDIFHPEGWTAP